jgi:transcriptional regulator with XRE-family HTH domain
MDEKPHDDNGFAERLRSLRTDAGLTLAALADRAGMHLHGVIKLERGERTPSWASVLALADALDVDITAFAPPRRRRRRPAKRKQK